MIIVRVEILRRKKERILLHLDSGEPVELALEVLERHSLGPGDTVASHTLRTLVEHGLLDDRAFAASYARSHISARPRGPFRIEQELRKKGVAPDVAHDAVVGVLEAEGITESALARKALKKWIRSQSLDTLDTLVSSSPSTDREKVRRRLYGFLTRRGFSPGITRTTLDEAGSLIRQGSGRGLIQPLTASHARA